MTGSLGPGSTILVGVDGSDCSARAATWAGALAAAVGADVIVAHALGLLEEPDQEHIRNSVAGEWSAPIAAAGVPLRSIVEHGPPASVLPAVAEREQVDLVVLGSRGTGGAPERLLGSTSHQVAQFSHVPVVIVPPEDE